MDVNFAPSTQPIADSANRTTGPAPAGEAVGEASIHERPKGSALYDPQFATEKPLSAFDWTVAVLAALIAAVIRVPVALHRGFWVDEYYTYYAAAMSVRRMIENRLDAGHSPLYYFYAKLGMLLGTGDLALRSTSILAVVLAVLALTGLMGAMGLRRHLPALWVIAIVHPYWMSTGTEYRYMMLLIAVAAGFFWAAVAWMRADTLRNGIVLTLAASALLWLHNSAQFIVGSIAISLLWQAIRQKRKGFIGVAGLALPTILAFLLSVPLLKMTHKHKGPVEGRLPDPLGVVENFSEVMYGAYDLWPRLLGWPEWPVLALEVTVLVAGFWLTRRELQRSGNFGSWRLLASILFIAPLTLILFSLVGRNVQGPARYLAALSVPMAICLAVAWRSRESRGMVWTYRLALVFALLIQSSAMALQRGDRHREGVAWIVQNFTDDDKLILSVMRATRTALDRQGMHVPQAGKIFNFSSRRARLNEDALDNFREFLEKSPRAFVVYYHSNAPVFQAVDLMKEQGIVLADRRWKLSETLTVAAIICAESERAWLDSLPDPALPWGPTLNQRPWNKDDSSGDGNGDDSESLNLPGVAKPVMTTLRDRPLDDQARFAHRNLADRERGF